MEMTRSKWWTVFFQTVVWAYVLITLAWYGLLEKPFLSYPNLPFEIACGTHKCAAGENPGPVKAGTAVSIIVTRCSSSDKERSYAITHALTNAASHQISLLPSSIVGATPGCNETISNVNIIPPGTPPGEYYVSGYAEVPGTFRSFLVPWRSATFEVVK